MFEDQPINKKTSGEGADRITGSEGEPTLEEALRKLVRLEEENANLRQEMREYKRNGVSGLRRREGFYRLVEDRLKEKAGWLLDGLEMLSDEGLIKKVDEWSLDTVTAEKFSVLMGDIAYLSLANKGGHRQGDNLLADIGAVATQKLGSPDIDAPEKGAYFVAYRHGGDEFSAVIEDTLENANKLAERFSEEVAKSKIGSLEKYGLEPRIDIGTAHLVEGLEAFKELVRGGVKIPGGNRMRKIQDLMIEIADQRSIIIKVKTRINFLMSLRAHKSDFYALVIDDLRKGALGAKDEEIDHLLENGGVDLFVDEKLEESMKEGQQGAFLEKDIVKKIATRGL